MPSLATPWTVAGQALLFMGFSRQEYWSGLPFPSPRDLPDPRIEPESPLPPALQADFFQLSHQESGNKLLHWGEGHVSEGNKGVFDLIVYCFLAGRNRWMCSPYVHSLNSTFTMCVFLYINVVLEHRPLLIILEMPVIWNI